MPRSSPSSLPIRRPGRRLPITAIALEALGFLIIALAIWLDELMDLPRYLFGAPASPFRPHEAVLESGLVILLAAGIITFTVRLVGHVDRLIVLCAWCHRVRLDTAWVSIEEFLRVHRADTSHGICPDCTARFDVAATPR
jgi:hypothetical protein